MLQNFEVIYLNLWYLSATAVIQMSSWIYIDTTIEIINLCIITQFFQTRIYFKNVIVPFIIMRYDTSYRD